MITNHEVHFEEHLHLLHELIQVELGRFTPIICLVTWRQIVVEVVLFSTRG